MKVLRLALLGLLCAPLLDGSAVGAVAPVPHDAAITLAAFGDLPASGARRRPRRQRDNKPSAPPEARKDPQGETPEQHKAYLKRYGF